MNVLNQKKVGNVIVTVTRYFGEIKLGLGGLIRSYSSITNNILNKAHLGHFCILKNTKAIVTYTYERLFLYIANKMKISVIHVQYKDSIIFEISSEKSWYSKFINIITNKTHRKVIFKSC